MAFIHKDIDRELLIKVDDKTLTSMCQVNQSNRRICRDPNFWRQRLSYFYNLNNDEIDVLTDIYNISSMDLYVYLSTSPKNTLKWMLHILDREFSHLPVDRAFIKLSKLYPEESPLPFNKLREIYRLIN